MTTVAKPDSRDIRLDELLGREVHARTGAPVGRLEELRCTGAAPYQVTEYVIGLAGLFDRLHIVRAVLGMKPRGFVATTGQLDLTDPAKPTLTCDLTELRRL
jgi:hypothetical protein